MVCRFCSSFSMCPSTRYKRESQPGPDPCDQQTTLKTLKAKSTITKYTFPSHCQEIHGAQTHGVYSKLHSLLPAPCCPILSAKSGAPAVVWVNVFSCSLGLCLIRPGCVLDKSVALWSLAAALKTQGPEAVLGNRPHGSQSYFLQEHNTHPLPPNPHP